MKKTLHERLGIILYDHIDDERTMKSIEPKLRELLADAQIEAVRECAPGFRAPLDSEIRERWGVET